MTTSCISLQTQASCDAPDIYLVFWFDGEMIHERPLTQETQPFHHEFPDQNDQQHCLEIEMRGKLPEHTLIDPDGKILSDITAEIRSVALDDIELGPMLSEKAVYYHDHNGSTDAVQDRFFGIMGCNGRVTLRFHTPTYLWLLENM